MLWTGNNNKGSELAFIHHKFTAHLLVFLLLLGLQAASESETHKIHQRQFNSKSSLVSIHSEYGTFFFLWDFFFFSVNEMTICQLQKERGIGSLQNLLDFFFFLCDFFFFFFYSVIVHVDVNRMCVSRMMKFQCIQWTHLLLMLLLLVL